MAVRACRTTAARTAGLRDPAPGRAPSQPGRASWWSTRPTVPPEGAFYLFVRAPADDDEAFTADLARRGVFVLPGTLFETPGFFRISLTASDAMIRRALPLFGKAAVE